ncbi:MAG: STAS domain-containing protein, partial [Armatimonadetes bacterium]|nr:STAS domain-containing protein [Armatimonadota bacterium]
PIIVNLTEVPFMDSTGIAAFLRTRQANHHSGSRLIVVTPSRDLHRVLQITGVSDMLTLVGTEGEALAAL